MIKIAPLKSSFMVMSIIGFFVSVLLIYPASPSFGFAFSIVFTAMFIASIISMTYSPIEEATPRDFDRGFSLHVPEDKSRPTLPKPRRKKATKRKPKKKVTKGKPKKKAAKRRTTKTSKKKTAKKKASRKKRR